ncbi:hypothetical protein EJ05DRAFT_477711 [Pseudovirgaria hyperparasitica]|uniref:Uncharacterized protein n=1 Tax=Pseudovirgaria hyperparasitica TaxID=470096 RepID=A0A6A6W4W1_9PEZI|nr:uncharacterized protein EJ05DRAFT_477711 [Pseudovirgaria hyperparasitica]KAF2756597.1 hypothetical protein EJ05DRAFT_477711 [Pseudovirgaria hyperparasitica]
MRLSQPTKALFLLINHLVAAHTPPIAIAPPHQVRGSGKVQALNNFKPRGQVDYDAGLAAVGLLSREESASCDRKARCRKKKIRNPSDPTKCIRCPPLTKPDPTRTICIRDKDVSEDDKRKQYEEKIKEKIKEKAKQFKDKIQERMDKKKEEKQKEWERKDKERRDTRNQKKARRMAVCLPLVAAAIGTQAMLELADGGFSTDLLDSIDMDLLALWPGSDIPDDFIDTGLPDDEKDILGEDFADEFLKVGDIASEAARRRSLENRATETTLTNNDMQGKSPEQKRFLNFIIQAFVSIGIAIGSAAARSAGAIGSAVARATRFFATRKPNLKKPGESKLSRQQQKDKAKEVSKNKNWNRCLKGQKAEK